MGRRLFQHQVTIPHGYGFSNKKARNNQIILPHSDNVNNVRFSPDGNTILTYTDNVEAIFIWNLDGSKQGSMPYQDVEIEKDIVFTPDSKKLVSINGKKICFWDLNGSKIIKSDIGAEILSVQFDNSLNSMFIITRQGLRCWILPESVKTWIRMHSEAITQLPRTIREHYELWNLFISFPISERSISFIFLTVI